MDNIDILIDLSLQIPQPILIGGWATYTLLDEGVTHDIDIIVEPWVRSLLHNIVDNYSENSHFGTVKGTGSVKGCPIDIYFLHESRLEGEISLDVTRLAEYVEGEWNGYLLLSKEAVIASKLPAVVGRSGTEKVAKMPMRFLHSLRRGVYQQKLDKSLNMRKLNPIQVCSRLRKNVSRLMLRRMDNVI